MRHTFEVRSVGVLGKLCYLQLGYLGLGRACVQGLLTCMESEA